MSMNVNRVSFGNVEPVKEVSEAKETSEVKKADLAEKPDTVELTKKESNLTKEEKQEIVHKARSNAAGWSAFGAVFSTLYYALRSDETVAKKYNLDPKEDKEFVKKIKQDQILYTLPAAIGVAMYGVGSLLAGGLTYLITKNMSSEKIDPDKKTF